jgi:hypothetical protein
MPKVVRGDCISSLAVDNGLMWQTIWEHPENADLRALRKEPNILMEGDEVFIPEREDGEQSGATEKKHRFRLKNSPAMLRLRVQRAGKAVADTKYTLVIDGEMRTGTTSAEGDIEEPIQPDAAFATLRLEGMLDVFDLPLGVLAPVKALMGVQQRLRNLGFNPGPADGEMGDRTRRALKDFQASVGLEPTGEADDATQDKLASVHDGV